MALEFLNGFAVWIIELIRLYGPWAVFLGVLIEEIIIPIPSPLILMAAGFILIDPSATLLQAMGQSLFTIVLPAAVAGTIGSFFPYYIGSYVRRGSAKYQGYVGIKKHHIDYLEKKMEKGSFLFIVVSRAIIIIPMSFVSFVAGFLDLAKRKFATATFVGTVPRAFLLALLGWYFGNTFTTVAQGLNMVENTVLLLILFAIAFFVVKNIRKRIKMD